MSYFFYFSTSPFKYHFNFFPSIKMMVYTLNISETLLFRLNIFRLVETQVKSIFHTTCRQGQSQER
jgi:hypothetical protein